MSDEDEVLASLREEHQRLIAERETTGGPALELAEELRRDALKVVNSGALAAVMGLQQPLAETMRAVQPLGAFYDAAGLSRMISESTVSAFAATDLIGSTAWMTTSVAPLFGVGMANQMAALNLAGPLAAEHLAALTGAFAGDYMKGFAGLLDGPLREWRELFEGYDEDEQRLLATMVPLGWLISPSMDMRTIRELARVDEVEQLDEALVAYFDPGRCAEIVDNLYGDPDFAELQPLLDEGIAVHTEGHYRAAVLVWLAVIDGIAKRKFGVSVFGESKRRASGKFRRLIEKGATSHDGLREGLIQILQRVSVKAPDPHVPKRDLVMHGAEVEFGNERASIQLILVLEVMHHCSPALHADDRPEAA